MARRRIVTSRGQLPRQRPAVAVQAANQSADVAVKAEGARATKADHQSPASFGGVLAFRVSAGQRAADVKQFVTVYFRTDGSVGTSPTAAVAGLAVGSTPDGRLMVQPPKGGWSEESKRIFSASKSGFGIKDLKIKVPEDWDKSDPTDLISKSTSAVKGAFGLEVQGDWAKEITPEEVKPHEKSNVPYMAALGLLFPPQDKQPKVLGDAIEWLTASAPDLLGAEEYVSSWIMDYVSTRSAGKSHVVNGKLTVTLKRGDVVPYLFKINIPHEFVSAPGMTAEKLGMAFCKHLVTAFRGYHEARLRDRSDKELEYKQQLLSLYAAGLLTAKSGALWKLLDPGESGEKCKPS